MSKVSRKVTDYEVSSEATVIVNGEKIPLKEFKRRFRKPKEPKEDKADDVKAPDVLGEALSGFRNICKPFASLSGFLTRSYRSFGKVSDSVIEPCRREWYTYSHRYRELTEIIDRLDSTSPRKVRDIRDYTERLSWKAEEVVEAAGVLWRKYDSKREWYAVNFAGQLVYEGRCRKGTEQMYDYGLKQLLLEKPSFTLEKASAKLMEKARSIAKIGTVLANVGY